MLEMRNLRLREVKPCAQGCRVWRWQVLNPCLTSSRAHVLSWKRLACSDVNFPSPSPVISWPFNAICWNSGSCRWLSYPHLQWVGVMALDHGKPGVPPPVLGIGPNPTHHHLPSALYIKSQILSVFLVTSRITMLRLLTSLLFVAFGKTSACVCVALGGSP